MTTRGYQPMPDAHALITAYFRAHRKLSAPTIVTHRSALNRLARFLTERGTDLPAATTNDLEDFLDALMAGTLTFSDGRPGDGRKRSPNSANSYRNVLRKFYGWAHANGKLPRRKPNPALGVDNRGQWQPEPPVVSDAEVKAMLRACTNDAMGARNRAMLAVLRFAGLRRAELVGLDVDAYHFASDVSFLTVGTAAHRTKSRRQRTVPLHPIAVDALENYMVARGEDAGPLFLSMTSDDGRLTPGGISQVLDGLRTRAGIKRRIGAHEFRRAWAIGLKRDGVSSEAVMVAAGWDDPTMVMRYTRAAKVELANAELARAYGAAREWTGATKAPRRPRLRRVS